MLVKLETEVKVKVVRGLIRNKISEKDLKDLNLNTLCGDIPKRPLVMVGGTSGNSNSMAFEQVVLSCLQALASDPPSCVYSSVMAIVGV